LISKIGILCSIMQLLSELIRSSRNQLDAPFSGLFECSLWLSLSVCVDRGVGGGGIVDIDGVVVAAVAVELPALDNCLAFRSVMGFPAVVA